MAPSVDTSNGAAANPPCSASTSSPVDWSKVRLGVDPAPTMFIAHWSLETGQWDGGELVPYGPLHLLPAAQVLNYGQSIFEGMKAYREDLPCTEGAAASGSSQDQAASAATENGHQEQRNAGDCSTSGGQGQGRVLLFRPGANAARFEAGAVRMCMPPVPRAMFLAAVHAVVRANQHYVPPPSRGSLYLRPLLLGTGPLLGLCPAPSYTFVLYAVPVGGRAKGGQLTALDYLIHDSVHRAAPRGVGATKAAGNYSPCLLAKAQAMQLGCHDCIYLDAKTDTYLEEGSGCNIFIVSSTYPSPSPSRAAAAGTTPEAAAATAPCTPRARVRISTPPAAGSILPGINRASLLELGEVLGYEVCEEPITVADAMQADEMFASGTAVVVQPIGSVTYQGKRVQLGANRPSPQEEANGSAQHDSQRPQQQHRHGEAESATSSGRASSDEGLGAASHSTSSGDALTPRNSNGISRGASEAADSEGTASCTTPDDDVACEPPEFCSYGGVRARCLRPEQRRKLQAAAPHPEPGSLPPGVGPVAQRLYGLLTSIQYGRVVDPFGWMVPVEMEGPTAGPLHLDRTPGVADQVPAEERINATAAAVTAAAGTGKVAAPPAAKLGRSVFADPNLE